MLQMDKSSKFPSPRRLIIVLLSPLSIATLIFGFAFGLRVLRLAWGYPYFLHPDEPQMFNVVLTMIRNSDPNPHHFYYGNGLFYLMQLWLAPFIGFANSRGWVEYVPQVKIHVLGIATTDLPQLILYGRLLTIILGSLTPVVVFDAARRLDARRGGMIAGLFLAASPLLVRESAWVLTNSPMVLLLSIGIWMASQFYCTGRWRWVSYSAMAMGLAASFKYTGAIGLLIPVSIVLFENQPAKFHRFLQVVSRFIFGFIALTPFALLDPYHFMRGIGGQYLQRTTGHAGAEGNTVYYFLDLLTNEESILLVILLVVSCITILSRRHKTFYPFIMALVVYGVVIFSEYVRFDRDLMPLLVLAAFLLSPLFQGVALRNKSLFALVAILLVGQPLSQTIWMLSADMQTPAQIETAQYLSQQIVGPAKILVIGEYSAVPPVRSDLETSYAANWNSVTPVILGQAQYLVLGYGIYVGEANCEIQMGSAEKLQFKLLEAIQGNAVCERVH